MYKNLFIIVFCAFMAISAIAKASEATMTNLNKAFNGEINASHRLLFEKNLQVNTYSNFLQISENNNR